MWVLGMPPGEGPQGLFTWIVSKSCSLDRQADRQMGDVPIQAAAPGPPAPAIVNNSGREGPGARGSALRPQPHSLL